MTVFTFFTTSTAYKPHLHIKYCPADIKIKCDKNNTESKGKAVPMHAMQMYGRGEVQLHLLLTSTTAILKISV